jgi:hypothetical protein
MISQLYFAMTNNEASGSTTVRVAPISDSVIGGMLVSKCAITQETVKIFVFYKK